MKNDDDFKLFRGFTDRQTDEQTDELILVIVESLPRLKKEIDRYLGPLVLVTNLIFQHLRNADACPADIVLSAAVRNRP